MAAPKSKRSSSTPHTAPSTKDESGPKLASKSRALRFAEAHEQVLAEHAETFRKLAK